MIAVIGSQTISGFINAPAALFVGLKSVGPILIGATNVIGNGTEVKHIPLVPVITGVYGPVSPDKLEIVNVLFEPGETTIGLNIAVAFGGRLEIERVTGLENPKY